MDSQIKRYSFEEAQKRITESPLRRLRTVELQEKELQTEETFLAEKN